MSGSAPGAALPWAASAAPAAEQQLSPEPEAPSEALPLDALGLSIGSRIEVRWEITPDDDDQPSFAKWWGARISRAAPAPPPGAPAAPGGEAYVLSYDADEAAGFDAEERRVQLTGEHELFDLEDGDTLVWRREGDAWEPPDTATLQDIVSGLPDEAELNEAEAAAMGDLDPATQRKVAAGFRDFSESFKEFIKGKLAAAAAAGAADEFVMTEGMVAEFKAAHSARVRRDQGQA